MSPPSSKEEEYASQETSMKQAASLNSHLRIFECVQGKEILINHPELKLE
jgi:hypothetical protein